MKRFSIALAMCGLLAAATPALSSLARAQTGAAATSAQVLPAPPRPVPSVLGTSVVPVVRPPATPHRRRPRNHARTAARAIPPASAKPAGSAKTPSRAGAAAGVAAGAALTAPSAGAPPVVGPKAVEPPKIDPNKGTVTGLPLPRWVAFRSDEVNLRSGPGTQYPIDWQYHRRNLPVRLTREFEAWRLVADPDGTKGWVHQATLTGRRGFIIKDSERTLRQSPADDAKPVALLKPGVVGYVRSCAAQAEWCELQAGDYRGWLKRVDFYGVDPEEAIN